MRRSCALAGGTLAPFLRYSSDVSAPKNAGASAVLSLVLPGVGQFYNGDFWRGIFWLIITPGLWIGSGGLLGWVCHVAAAVTAYKRAERKNRLIAEARVPLP